MRIRPAVLGSFAMRYYIKHFTIWLLVVAAFVQSFNLNPLNYAVNMISSLPCSFIECCSTDMWVSANITSLEESLINNVYGQHLVREIVVNAFRSHFREDVHPSKALAISFHGWPGGGKNYVSSFIVNSIYKAGFKSKFVHFFSGMIDFPLKSQTDIYKMQLIDWVRGNVSACERSIFIFDEVDKMHERILDGIKPFIDYHPSIGNVDFRKSIFIFLSNTGGNLITQRIIDLWSQGKKREQLELNDFEDLIRKGAFNEKGGFHKNEAVESNLIDYYVPFLPMERKHVRQCIINEFQRRDSLQQVDESLINTVLNELTFGPEPSLLFSIAGCKRISQKVAILVERQKYQSDKYHYDL